MTTHSKREALKTIDHVWALVYPGRVTSYHASHYEAEATAFCLIMRTASTDDRLIVERSGDDGHTATSFALLRKDDPDGNIWAEVERIKSDQMSEPKGHIVKVG